MVWLHNPGWDHYGFLYNFFYAITGLNWAHRKEESWPIKTINF